MQKILTLLMAIFYISMSQAQNHKNVPSVNTCVGKSFSVMAWVIEDTMGQANLTQANVQVAIDDLNAAFDDVCVSFNLCDYTVLPNARQTEPKINNEDKEIATIHQVKNVINIVGRQMKVSKLRKNMFVHVLILRRVSKNMNQIVSASQPRRGYSRA